MKTIIMVFLSVTLFLCLTISSIGFVTAVSTSASAGKMYVKPAGGNLVHSVNKATAKPNKTSTGR